MTRAFLPQSEEQRVVASRFTLQASRKLHRGTASLGPAAPPLPFPAMIRQLSPLTACLLSLAVILLHGHQVRAKGIAAVTETSQPRTPSVKASLSNTESPASQEPSATRLTTSQGTATASSSENPATLTAKTLATAFPGTVNGTSFTGSTTQGSVTSQATHSTSHRTTSVTEATIGPGVTSQPASTYTLSLTTGASAPVSSHTTGKVTQPSSQTPQPVVVSSSPHPPTSTASQTSPKSTCRPGLTTALPNATETPAITVPGPSLAPQPTAAKTGLYQVLNGSGLCIKVEMGVQLIIQDTESVASPKSYFNIDPNATHTSGNCSSRKASLLLSFPGGYVNLTFTKDETSYYLSEIGASLTSSRPEKNYQGRKSGVVMFEAVVGHSFKCVSEQNIQLSPQLQLQTVNVQLQVFDFEGTHFGNADECFSDRNRREIPVAVGLSIAGLLGILLTACLVARMRPTRGYERL